MKQFRLKFTTDNLKRHLAHDMNVIVTTRDEPKAEIGDMCNINGLIYVLSDIFQWRLSDMRFKMGQDVAEKSGFNDWYSYYSEIHSLFGDDDLDVYVHTLRLLDTVQPPTLDSRVDKLEKNVRYLQNLLHDHLQEEE